MKSLDKKFRRWSVDIAKSDSNLDLEDEVLGKKKQKKRLSARERRSVRKSRGRDSQVDISSKRPGSPRSKDEKDSKDLKEPRSKERERRHSQKHRHHSYKHLGSSGEILDKKHPFGGGIITGDGMYATSNWRPDANVTVAKSMASGLSNLKDGYIAVNSNAFGNEGLTARLESLRQMKMNSNLTASPIPSKFDLSRGISNMNSNVSQFDLTRNISKESNSPQSQRAKMNLFSTSKVPPLAMKKPPVNRTEQKEAATVLQKKWRKHNEVKTEQKNAASLLQKEWRKRHDKDVKSDGKSSSKRNSPRGSQKKIPSPKDSKDDSKDEPSPIKASSIPAPIQTTRDSMVSPTAKTGPLTTSPPITPFEKSVIGVTEDVSTNRNIGNIASSAVSQGVSRASAGVNRTLSKESKSSKGSNRSRNSRIIDAQTTVPQNDSNVSIPSEKPKKLLFRDETENQGNTDILKMSTRIASFQSVDGSSLKSFEENAISFFSPDLSNDYRDTMIAKRATTYQWMQKMQEEEAVQAQQSTTSEQSRYVIKHIDDGAEKTVFHDILDSRYNSANGKKNSSDNNRTDRPGLSPRSSVGNVKTNGKSLNTGKSEEENYPRQRPTVDGVSVDMKAFVNNNWDKIMKDHYKGHGRPQNAEKAKKQLRQGLHRVSVLNVHGRKNVLANNPGFIIFEDERIMKLNRGGYNGRIQLDFDEDCNNSDFREKYGSKKRARSEDNSTSSSNKSTSITKAATSSMTSSGSSDEDFDTGVLSQIAMRSSEIKQKFARPEVTFRGVVDKEKQEILPLKNSCVVGAVENIISDTAAIEGLILNSENFGNNSENLTPFSQELSTMNSAQQMNWAIVKKKDTISALYGVAPTTEEHGRQPGQVGLYEKQDKEGISSMSNNIGSANGSGKLGTIRIDSKLSSNLKTTGLANSAAITSVADIREFIGKKPSSKNFEKKVGIHFDAKVEKRAKAKNFTNKTVSQAWNSFTFSVARNSEIVAQMKESAKKKLVKEHRELKKKQEKIKNLEASNFTSSAQKSDNKNYGRDSYDSIEDTTESSEDHHATLHNLISIGKSNSEQKMRNSLRKLHEKHMQMQNVKFTRESVATVVPNAKNEYIFLSGTREHSVSGLGAILPYHTKNHSSSTSRLTALSINQIDFKDILSEVVVTRENQESVAVSYARSSHASDGMVDLCDHSMMTMSNHARGSHHAAKHGGKHDNPDDRFRIFNSHHINTPNSHTLSICSDVYGQTELFLSYILQEDIEHQPELDTAGAFGSRRDSHYSEHEKRQIKRELRKTTGHHHAGESDTFEAHLHHLNAYENKLEKVRDTTAGVMGSRGVGSGIFTLTSDDFNNRDTLHGFATNNRSSLISEYEDGENVFGSKTMDNNLVQRMRSTLHGRVYLDHALICRGGQIISNLIKAATSSDQTAHAVAGSGTRKVIEVSKNKDVLGIEELPDGFNNESDSRTGTPSNKQRESIGSGAESTEESSTHHSSHHQHDSEEELKDRFLLENESRASFAISRIGSGVKMSDDYYQGVSSMLEVLNSGSGNIYASDSSTKTLPPKIEQGEVLEKDVDNFGVCYDVNHYSYVDNMKNSLLKRMRYAHMKRTAGILREKAVKSEFGMYVLRASFLLDFILDLCTTLFTRVVLINCNIVSAFP